MITSADEVYQFFFDKLENDRSFFAYYGVDETEAMDLAKERSSSYLRDAMIHLRRKAELAFELGVTADGEFVEEITDDEADLLAEIMVWKHYDRKLAQLQPMVNMFAKAEMTLLHSPANERASYAALVKQREESIREMISDYAAKERLSTARKMVDHTIPDEE